MHPKSVKLVYFSPTGTTKAVATAIATGTNVDAVDVLDITPPDARETPLEVSGDALLIVAVPVYMGRVPAVIVDWLNTISGNNTPTVCVAVYGNRDFDDALLELKTILSSRGCVPVAYGAYIGEHSFSTAEHPVAQGRPNEEDLRHARKFGQQLREKLTNAASISQAAAVPVPGVFPYRKDSTLWSVDFIEVSEQCPQCGVCAEVCPVGAVDPHNSALIDQEKCITCCACIKSCPEQARTLKPGPVMDASVRLFTNCSEPKQPEFFL